MTISGFAMGCIIWLYAIVAIRNGGGFVTTVAILGTFGTAVSGAAYAFWTADLILAGTIVGAIVAAFIVSIWATDDGIVN